MMTTMQQIQIAAYGGPEVLKPVTVEVPQPGPGEVLIRTAAIGVNYSDVLRRRNTYFMPTPLPYVPGAEAVGEVVAHGDGLEDSAPQIGQRILGILPHGGAYAEYAVVPARFCVPLPPQIDAAVATALFVQGSTAYGIIAHRIGDLEGKSVLVHAAAGGVGSLLVQLARQRGAKVLGTTSKTSKLAQIEALGAIPIDYSHSDWPAQVIAANGDAPVDYALEMVGGKIYEQSFTCLRQGGTMVVFGAASGQKGRIHSEHFVDQEQHLLSFNLAYFIRDQMADWQAALGAIIGQVASGQLQIQVDHQFPLAEASQAHQAIEARMTSGKVVLIP